VAKATETRPRVVCMWCREVMRPGNPPDTDLVSHGCCCACAMTHFPAYWEGPAECDFEVVAREHDEDSTPVELNPFTGSIRSHVGRFHVETLRCKSCHSEQTTDVEPCEEPGCQDVELDEKNSPSAPVGTSSVGNPVATGANISEDRKT